jgi:hypothetical protein
MNRPLVSSQMEYKNRSHVSVEHKNRPHVSLLLTCRVLPVSANVHNAPGQLSQTH